MKFDFSGRFQNAFGFIAGNISAKLIEQGFGEEVKESGLNLAVYNLDSNTSFDEVTLRRYDASYRFAYSSISDDYKGIFATPPMFSLKRAKKLVITPIDNSDFEVVERYGTEPWEISWRGLLIDMENHEFPLDKLQELNKIFDVNDIWSVDSDILLAVGVDSIYIKDISIDFVEGYEDTVAYTLTMRQIKSLEYSLIN